MANAVHGSGHQDRTPWQAGVTIGIMTGWTVAILSSREAPPRLAATIEAALRAVGGREAVIDVVVNGNRPLVEAVLPLLRALPLGTAPGATVRLWELPFGDKAHAWNSYLHSIWPGGDPAFFVDGYVAVRPDAMALVAEGLDQTPHAIAATGMPSVGRSARKLQEKLRREGGTHGNFHALRGETMARLRESGFRLPLGLYRTDALINSVLSLNLDPARHEWDPSRVLVHPTATWDFEPLAWHRPRDLLAQLRRVLRQLRGELEKQAFGHYLIVLRHPPAALASTTAGMVTAWLAALPDGGRSLFRSRPMLRLAARRLIEEQRDWSAAQEPPRLVGAVGPGATAWPPSIGGGVGALAAALPPPCRPAPT